MKCSVDRRLLIQEVKNRPMLWDRKNKSLGISRSMINMLWEEVGVMCAVSGENAKQVWRNLKDQFRRIYIAKPHVKARCKWIYYKDLMFMKDVVDCTTRTVRINNSDSSENKRMGDDTYCDDDDDDVIFIKDEPMEIYYDESGYSNLPGYSNDGNYDSSNHGMNEEYEEGTGEDITDVVGYVKDETRSGRRKVVGYNVAEGDRQKSREFERQDMTGYDEEETAEFNSQEVEDYDRLDIKEGDRPEVEEYCVENVRGCDKKNVGECDGQNVEYNGQNVEYNGQNVEYNGQNVEYNGQNVEYNGQKSETFVGQDFDEQKSSDYQTSSTEIKLVDTESNSIIIDIPKDCNQTVETDRLQRRIHRKEKYVSDLRSEITKLEKIRNELKKSDDSENCDLQFFRSLLLYMDEFTPLEKLEVRTKIQQVVLDKYTQKCNKK